MELEAWLQTPDETRVPARPISYPLEPTVRIKMSYWSSADTEGHSMGLLPRGAFPIPPTKGTRTWNVVDFASASVFAFAADASQVASKWVCKSALLQQSRFA